MISNANTELSGILFSSGQDVTADFLTSLQQNISNELIGRTKDFIKVPGFAWGLRAVSTQGKAVTISQGVGIDQNGTRLYHPDSASYDISFPNTNATVGWLCVKANPISTAYRVHPYTGVRHPTESLVSLTFYVDTVTPYSIGESQYYPSDNLGLIVAKLSVVVGGYTIVTEAEVLDKRSPYLKMADGT